MTLAVPDGNEVVVLVEGSRLVVYRIDDDELAAADFRCGDGFAQCVEEQLFAISLTRSDLSIARRAIKYPGMRE